MKDKDVINGWNRQDRHSLLFPQHAASGAQSCPQEPAPGPGRGAPCRTVFHVAEQGEEEEETGPHIGPAHDSCHRLRVDGVRGKHQASHEGPVSIPKQDLGEAREETSDRRMQEHVDKMVAPGIQPSDGMVQAERKSAERPVGLVAAAVG